MLENWKSACLDDTLLNTIVRHSLENHGKSYEFLLG